MFNAKVLDRFLDLYPISDYGKILSHMKSRIPTRPIGASKTVPATIAWVAVRLSDRVQPDLTGVVYKTPRGDVIYWPMHADGETKPAAEARYVLDVDILKQAVDGWLDYDGLALGEVAKIEDQQAFKRALWGDLLEKKEVIPLRFVNP